MSNTLTWVHWKVLELSFDETPLPDLLIEHEYHGLPSGSSRIPASGLAETSQALRDLLTLDAVAVIGRERLTDHDALDLVIGDGTWTDAISVVDRPLATELLDGRQAEESPHRPF